MGVFMFFKLYKWYTVLQSVSYRLLFCDSAPSLPVLNQTTEPPQETGSKKLLFDSIRPIRLYGSEKRERVCEIVAVVFLSEEDLPKTMCGNINSRKERYENSAPYIRFLNFDIMLGTSLNFCFSQINYFSPIITLIPLAQTRCLQSGRFCKTSGQFLS